MKTFLQASIVAGLRECAPDDFDGCEIVSESYFCDSLPSLAPHQVIGAWISENTRQALADEYGIK